MAFEPNPAACALARTNLTKKGYSDVTIQQMAVGLVEEEREFFINSLRPGSLRSSFSKDRAEGSGHNISVSRLSRWLPEVVDFMKIDVEGAEHEVLDDLIEADRLKTVRMLAIEYHHHLSPGDDQLGGFLRKLEDNELTYTIEGTYSQESISDFQDLMILAAPHR